MSYDPCLTSGMLFHGQAHLGRFWALGDRTWSREAVMTPERGRGGRRWGAGEPLCQGCWRCTAPSMSKKEPFYLVSGKPFVPSWYQGYFILYFLGSGFGKDEAELSAINAGCNGRVIAVAVSPDQYLLQENSWMAMEAKARIDLIVLFCL